MEPVSRKSRKFLRARKAVFTVKIKGLNSFTDNMIKLLAHKIKWIGWLAMIHYFSLDI